MKFLSVAVVLAAAQSVAGECWRSGPDTEAEIGAVKAKIGDICDYFTASGSYNAAFKKGEERYMCVQFADHKWDFSLKMNSEKNNGVIGIPECSSGMNKQVDCTHDSKHYGGQTAYGHWEYRADPNSGRCMGET